jgi:hypothetical protein
MDYISIYGLIVTFLVVGCLLRILSSRRFLELLGILSLISLAASIAVWKPLFLPIPDPDGFCLRHSLIVWICQGLGDSWILGYVGGTVGLGLGCLIKHFLPERANPSISN